MIRDPELKTDSQDGTKTKARSNVVVVSHHHAKSEPNTNTNSSSFISSLFYHSRWRTILALAMGMLTTILLHLHEPAQGYVRDEGIYFEASRRYATWLKKFESDPLEAGSPKSIRRYFSINHEHPALMKLLAGQSARLFAKATHSTTPQPVKKSHRTASSSDASTAPGVWPIMREAAAMRLPAQVITGIGVAILIFMAWGRWGFFAGMLSGGGFILLPRITFHANLHCFDIPIAVVGIIVTLAYLRALRSPAWGIGLGPILGIAISIKHNALFFPVLFFAHYILCLQLSPSRARQTTSWLRFIPLPFVSMTLLAPLTVWILWPWLWHETTDRWIEYFVFHRHHSYYNMEFLGTNFNRPPLPIAYPWLMTWATVPSTLLVLAFVGLVRGIILDLNQSEARKIAVNTWLRPLEEHPQETALFGILAIFPLLLISLPEVPIFGGTKHWLTAYPFIALLAASAWADIWKHAGRMGGSWIRLPIQTLVLVLVLVPGSYSLIHGHGLNLSQYSPFAGGARGAARMGLNRGFWGFAGIRDFVSNPPSSAKKLYLHDLHPLAQQQYLREGDWPKEIANSNKLPLGKAWSSLFFHEKHMIRDEVRIWNRMQTTVPTTVWSLDDVPLTSLYTRSGK